MFFPSESAGVRSSITWQPAQPAPYRTTTPGPHAIKYHGWGSFKSDGPTTSARVRESLRWGDGSLSDRTRKMSAPIIPALTRESNNTVIKKRNPRPQKTKKKSLVSKSSYEIKVTTGRDRNAATNAKISLTLHGERGKLKRVLNDDDDLDKGSRGPRGRVFNIRLVRGQTEQFEFEAKNIGLIDHITVENGEAEETQNWLLESITVTKIDRISGKNRTWLFAHNDWIYGGNTENIYPGKRKQITPGEKYKVSVHTGDKRYAGTDAAVYINIFGDKGETGDTHLNKPISASEDVFERDQVDEFEVVSADIGDINKIRIGHDNSNAASGWYLDKVTITPLTGKIRGKPYVFPCKRWLDLDEDDGQIVRELYLPQKAIAPLTTYYVHVRTGDVHLAGTDANVFINIIGQKGDTGVQTLASSETSENKFEQGQTDIFTVKSPDIGKIQKIHIGHDGAGLGAGWYLDDVKIDAPTSESSYLFKVDRWLDTEEEDGKLDVKIGKPKLSPYRKKSKYKVIVKTGDKFRAGTDANVYVTIYGDKAQTEELPLTDSLTNTNKFEKNQEDIFEIDTFELGRLKTVKIRHDNTGLSSDWFLGKISVEDSGGKYNFPCNEWLNGKTGLTRTLATDTQPAAASAIYKVTVVTGDMRDAGTEADVYLILYGKKKTSDKWVQRNEGDLFRRGATDVFLIESDDVGEIERLKVGHTGSYGAAWNIASVTIEDTDCGRLWDFQCGRWLAKDKEDRQMEAVFICRKQRNIQKGVLYEVTLHTTDRSRASTNANVYVMLRGASGRTRKDSLCPSVEQRKDYFNQGNKDKFIVTLEDIGDVTSVVVGHDGSGQDPGWHLDQVVVTRHKVGKEKQTKNFPCGRWLSRKEDDGQTQRELWPAQDRVKDKRALKYNTSNF